jgi:uncharacterized tellurite resistance protein B-like protein
MSSPPNPLLIREYRLQSLDATCEESRIAYIAALWKIAQTGGVTKNEDAFITELAAIFGVSDATLKKAKKLPKDKLDFSKLEIDVAYLIRDAARVAFSDGVVDKLEDKMIANLSKIVGVSREKTAWIFSWVEREFHMDQEWRKIINEPEPQE